MLIRIAAACRKHGLGMAAVLLAGLAAVPLAAQSIERVDPDAAIDADLSGPSAAAPTPEAAQPTERYPAPQPRYADATLDLPPETYPAPGATTTTAVPPADSTGGVSTTVDPSTTYAQDDLIGAAEGLFGKGAEGLARLIQDILEEQGEPNAYIVGREGGGAFIVGVRYGSGTLFHRVEGNMPVYWTGPSIGFDAGANAGNTFVLVYNLDDSEDLYRRYPAGEGQAYLVGGFTASYLRRGNTVLIPIRVGAGLRLGVNAGYMRFSHEQRWLPF
jgi:hypothetical protein